MRRAAALLATCALATLALIPARPSRGTLLWPGARFTAQERDRAVERGLVFVYGLARDPAVFHAWGHDLTGAFAGVAATSRDPRLRSMAWRMGHERAREWRRLNRSVPPDADLGEVCALLMGSDSAALLGTADPALWNQLRLAAARFSAVDYFHFDPALEGPPADVPNAHCGRQAARGVRACPRCGKPLRMRSRYELWTDALITTYTGDRYGVTLGANYVDALRWLPAMRPYPAPGAGDERDAIFAVTHLVYTLNDYSVNRLDPKCLPEEFAYLAGNLRHAIAGNDPEIMGEVLDTLRAFGLGLDDPLIRTGVEHLLASQNPDGSWGDPKDPDVYGRYHSTWTAVDGLREYNWTRTLPCVEP